MKYSHWGWFLFCPVYLNLDDIENLMPVPFLKMWWLFDLALSFQQMINWFISFYDDESCGFMFYRIKKLKKEKIF